MFEMETVPGNTRVIFIHRDGRDVALSFKARGYSWDKSVARWVDDNRAAVPFLDRPEVLSVGFEELTTAGSVLPMLRRVADFLGLQVTDGQLVVALVPGTQPHDYQEYCSAYRNDAEKAADLAASLVAVIAGKGANLFEGQSEGQDGVPSSGETLTGSKLEQHNAFRTWQMSQAWAEVPKVQRREWSAEEERQFYDNEAAMELMRRFGYIAERDDGGVR